MFYIKQTANELCEEAARLFVARVIETTAKNKLFYLSLSGGQTPKILFAELVKDRWSRQIPWEKIVFFWGDERFVPADDVRSNQKMAREYLLAHIPAKHVYPVPVLDTAEAAAAAYEKQLYQVFGGVPRFDLVLLGMGADGHTASLFREHLRWRKHAIWPVRFVRRENLWRGLRLPIRCSIRQQKYGFLSRVKKKHFPSGRFFMKNCRRKNYRCSACSQPAGKSFGLWMRRQQLLYNKKAVMQYGKR